MEAIPDTGGGLSGFIAWLLWQLYVYFPFEGTWDWLLLIVFLAVLLRLLMVPVWWRLKVEDLEDSGGRIVSSLLAGLLELIWPWLVIWFFNTAAGRTFFEGRSGQPLRVLGFVYLPYVVGFVGLLIGGSILLTYFFRRLSFAKHMNGMGFVCVHSLIGATALYFLLTWCGALTVSTAVLALFATTAMIQDMVLVWLNHVRLLRVQARKPTRYGDASVELSRCAADGGWGRGRR